MPTIVSIIFDLILVAVIAIAVILGKHKGLLLTVYMLGIVIIAIYLGKICMPFVVAGLTDLKVDESINTKVTETMMEVADNNPDIDLADLTEKLRLPNSMVESIEKNVSEAIDAKGEQLVYAISDFVTEISMKIISYVLVTLIVIAILLVVFVVLKLARKIPVLGKIDEIGGGILGGITGLAIIFIVCGILYAYGLLHNEGVISDIAGHSYIIKALDYIGFFKLIIK